MIEELSSMFDVEIVGFSPTSETDALGAQHKDEGSPHSSVSFGLS
jgi:hypothetical protein